jgi:tagaturonate reductase
MEHLSKNMLSGIQASPGLIVPEPGVWELPEKVLQFGTGVLLRGLPDYFIDKANRNGIFNGRVVIVKSTSSGGTDEFGRQDGLFTHVIRGIDQGKEIDKAVINSSVSRVLAASDAWDEILACARNPEMKLIISNTTEVGLSLLSGDDMHAHPPKSFPGKLLAVLHERFKTFQGDAGSGFVIVPTELIPDNGILLRDIVLMLAAQNGCSDTFIKWVKESNEFCSSLVDRIVPGRLTGDDLEKTQAQLGYTDDLMIMSEVFRLWAIECTHPWAKSVLSFSLADEGVVLTDDLEKFRELKLRLLNGTHTLSCALAFISGFETVREAMEDEEMGRFITRMAIEEIAPARKPASLLPVFSTVFAILFWCISGSALRHNTLLK